MNAGVFAEWLRRQGLRVEQTASSYWFEASPRVYQAFPYHWIIEPSEDEVAGLLRRQRAIAVRYSSPISARYGKVSYHVICQGDYDLRKLSRQARQNVQRGLQYAQIEPIPLARLAEEGWILRRETLARQDRAGAESETSWRRLCKSAEGLPGFEAWGAIHEGELVASFLAFVCDDCYTLPYEQSATGHLQHRVNNAIFYAVTQQALQRPSITKVFFCLQSLDAPCSVDEFKFRMGYAAHPVCQRVVFHPWLLPAATASLGHTVVKRLCHRHPQNAQMAKAEGMLRFYLEGRLSPAQQSWPEVMDDQLGELPAT